MDFGTSIFNDKIKSIQIMMEFMLPFPKTKPFLSDTKNIQVLRVENPILTANYYKEYLDFELINSNSENKNCRKALLRLNNQNILLVEPDPNQDNEQQSIILRFNFDISQMNTYYIDLKQKARIIHSSSNNKKEISEFSIKDCNGHVLHFRMDSANN
jgi:hypothetical protein